jgi:hypothetical protein
MCASHYPQRVRRLGEIDFIYPFFPIHAAAVSAAHAFRLF